MSRSLDRRLPPIDLHAHIAPNVTAEQLTEINPSLTFAVTRSIAEAAQVRARSDPGLVWGCGVHPSIPDALAAYDATIFEELLSTFMFVGEVGLDSRGSSPQQRDVLSSVLTIASRHDVIVSLHSSGRSSQVVELLEHHRPAGAVLHWFTGGSDLIQRAVAAGAFFSVNSSAKEEVLAALPQDRVLTETDYPATKRTGSRLPADVGKIEARLGALWDQDEEAVRRTIWQNLRGLATASATLSRFPRDAVQTLISA